MGELAPAELPQIGFDVRPMRRVCALRSTIEFKMNLPRRNLAEVQMRRQPRGAVPCRQIAGLRVVIDGVVPKNFQHLLRADLAGPPGISETPIPTDGR